MRLIWEIASLSMNMPKSPEHFRRRAAGPSKASGKKNRCECMHRSWVLKKMQEETKDEPKNHKERAPRELVIHRAITSKDSRESISHG